MITTTKKTYYNLDQLIEKSQNNIHKGFEKLRKLQKDLENDIKNLNNRIQQMQVNDPTRPPLKDVPTTQTNSSNMFNIPTYTYQRKYKEHKNRGWELFARLHKYLAESPEFHENAYLPGWHDTPKHEKDQWDKAVVWMSDNPEESGFLLFRKIHHPDDNHIDYKPTKEIWNNLSPYIQHAYERTASWYNAYFHYS